MNSIVRHTENSGAENLIIFVHGFTGGSNTFSSAKGSMLFELLDPTWTSRCDFSSFVYHSRLLDFAAARKVLGTIPILNKAVSPSSNRTLKQYASLLKTHVELLMRQYKSVNFICHSMGGIVVKHMLVDYFQTYQTFPGFYITLATPHRGVEQARSLGTLLNHVQVQNLAPFSEDLDRLSSEWEGISGHANVHYYCGIDDDLVNELSSCPPKERHKLTRVDGTHTTMCKPGLSDSPLIGHLNATIPQFLRLSQSRSQAPSLTHLDAEDILFIAYKPTCEEFYLVRHIDQDLANAVTHANVWISGRSGLGKTNAIQRLMYKCGRKSLFVDLSPCVSSHGAEALLSHIYYVLHTEIFRMPPREAISEGVSFIHLIAKLLSSLPSDQRYIIFIDEIPPCDAEILHDFLNSMVALAVNCSQLASCSNVRIVLSTLLSPSECIQGVYGSKLSGLFVTHSLALWTSDELTVLLRLLLAGLALPLPDHSMSAVVQGSRGSPRNLKNILRKLILFRGRDDIFIEEVIAEVVAELPTP